MMADSDLDKNAEATPHKLQKARENGQVTKSTEMISLAVFIVTLSYVNWRGSADLMNQFQFDRALLVHAQSMNLNIGSVGYLVKQMAWSASVLMLPFFACVMLMGILANMAQTGPIFSLEPLKIDMQRLNPVTGFKRIFSGRLVFEGLKTLIKFSALVGAAWIGLKNLAKHQLLEVTSRSPLRQLHMLIDDITGLCFRMVLAMFMVAVLDILYSRFEYSKKMRMSQRELKDEYKSREGDPRIKTRLRQLQQESLQRSRTLRNMRAADVLITNPTHVAIALIYKRGEMPSPLLLAKGKGALATSMRETAYRFHIPIVHSPELARQLYAAVKAQQHIPSELYAAVAKIYIWVLTNKSMHKTQSMPETEMPT